MPHTFNNISLSETETYIIQVKGNHYKMLKDYYYLTKPGIIYGNAINTTGGFLLASKGNVNFSLFLAVLVGTALVIASACVFNNYIDQEIDQKMARTKKRALVTGAITDGYALIFASLLGVFGFAVLTMFTNNLTVLIGLLAMLTYIVFYGIGKRRSVHGTLIGSFAGAAPPMAGYCAAAGYFDLGALLVGLILILWQMPHFYAIAMYRREDYANAGIPVLPVKKGLQITKLTIVMYIMSFTLATISLTIYGYTGFIFLIVMSSFGLGWLLLGLQDFNKNNHTEWARKMFHFSLIVILALSVMMSVGPLLP